MAINAGADRPGGEAERPARLFLLSGDDALAEALLGLWPAGRAEWKTFRDMSRAVETVFLDPPDLLLVDIRQGYDYAEATRLVKSENVYRQIPVVLLLGQSPSSGGVDFQEVEADDFLMLPLDADQARVRLHLALLRAERGMDASPLTRLPGNTTIIRRIRQAIGNGREFALGCLDITGFRAFNDKYGFPRGDEVLMMTARVLVNSLRTLSPGHFFVGHAGGDDFFFLCAMDCAEDVCQGIIRNFDDIIPSFYDKADRDAGMIRLTARDGAEHAHPLLTVAIGITTNASRRLKHPGQASAVARALANHAKREKKSACAFDRRRQP